MLFFWIAASIGVASLLVATVYLVAVNWSDDMYPRVVSALGAGALTLLVTVLATLKNSREELKFTTTVLFDNSTRRLPILRPDPAHGFSITLERLNDLATATAGQSAPQTPDEVFVFLGELLQYRLLVDLRDIQRTGTSVGVMVGSPSLEVRPAQPIVTTSDRIEVAPSEIVGYSSNRFSKSETAEFGWQTMGGVRVPRGTSIHLSQRTGPTKHTIELLKRNYFKFEISIEGISGGPPGRLPQGLLLPGSNASAYIYDVAMTAEFEKLTAGNWRTAEYKRWVGWLMSEISERNRPREVHALPWPP
jgi:hypothetical protein